MEKFPGDALLAERLRARVVVGWVDGHGCLETVETGRQRWAGQLDGHCFVKADGSLRGAKRPAPVIAALVAGRDFGGEIDGGNAGPARSDDAQGEAG